ATVYEKGAEVVRMIHTLLGAENFRRGSDLYFERHDGQAVTCEDFVLAMEDASGVDLCQFRNWYSQAGTPQLTVEDEYDAAAQCYTLHIQQSCPATPGQPEKLPFVIPLAMGLLGEAGGLPLRQRGKSLDFETTDNTHTVLTIDQQKQSFIFDGVAERTVPSLLRGFSAPVRLHYSYTNHDLCALMRRDGDGFVRWNSSQTLLTRIIFEVEQQLLAGASVVVDHLLIEACAELLRDESLDPAMVAEMLRLPGEDFLAEQAGQSGGANVDSIHQARDFVRSAVGKALAPQFLERYQALESMQPYEPEATQIADRSLRNTCLAYLVSASSDNLALASRQYRAATNMTDRQAALKEIAFYASHELRDSMLESFYQDWRHEGLVINQWLQLQAAIPDSEGLPRVKSLTSHVDFDFGNPNKVRALIGGFANHNPVNFHRLDGSGYRFLSDVVIKLNKLNPQLASRLLTPLTRWRWYENRGTLMQAELERLAAEPALSSDVFEIVSKSLK
ncbi:MAG: DUF3458 domain-containing protein, partial [Halioglobus sp.]|nr:DUF3458 domain-containing protein [Halioglobus sp.]